MSSVSIERLYEMINCLSLGVGGGGYCDALVYARVN